MENLKNKSCVCSCGCSFFVVVEHLVQSAEVGDNGKLVLLADNDRIIDEIFCKNCRERYHRDYFSEIIYS